MSFNGYSLGIMQGRLTEPKGRGIQFFPFENWENEFYMSAELGLDEIEFIFDYDRYEENPLFTADGHSRINTAVKNSGVVINTVNLDYFMRRPFYKSDSFNTLRQENAYIINKVLDACQAIGAAMLDVPLVDNSSIADTRQEVMFIEFIREIAENSGIYINFETDFSTDKYKRFIEDIDRENINIIYDSGDRASLGFNAYDEVLVLGQYIKNVHVKDKKYMGGTFALGQGDTNISGLFAGLRDIAYSGSVILQVGRGVDGDEIDYMKEQLHYVKNN